MQLSEIIDLDELQSIQDSFAKSCNLSSVILSPAGEPITRFSNPTSFCSLIQSTEKGKRRCQESFLEMDRRVIENPDQQMFYCFVNCGHFVSPIIVEQEHIATMFAGQFKPGSFTEEELGGLKKTAEEIGLSPERLVDEAEHMRIVDEDTIGDYAILLTNIVRVIADQGARTLEAQSAREAQRQAYEELQRQSKQLENKVELIKEQNELILKQNRTIQDLSTPILQIWDSVLVLPVIGVVDTRRSMQIMENTLNEITRLQARFLIMDITGVEVVDTKTADHLIKVVKAAHLLGTRCILTGIQSAVAQTLVDLDIGLSDIVTRNNLKEGLKECLRQMQMENKRIE
jgi:anti-anti-sigma regulatory factor/ligand-binding sensor protein